MDKRKALGEMEGLASIKSILISLGQLAVGETVSAKTVNLRLQEE